MQEITSLKAPIVKHLVRLRKEKKYRQETKTVLVQGKKLINELLQDRRAKVIVFSDPTLLAIEGKSEEIILTKAEIIKKITGSESPEGIVAEFPMPHEGAFHDLSYLLALDGVSDPGNLGTLLRTAYALGWDGAFLLGNCCDPYNDKALRAAKGATFKLPLKQGNWAMLDKILENNGLEPFAADMEGQNVSTLTLKGGVLLVLGSEGQGLSEESLKRCKRLSIPMQGACDSLNVSIAGAILMYLLNFPGKKGII